MLAQYPEHIIRAVSDPRTGLPATSKLLPTVSEIREACERIADAERGAIKRAEDLQKQLTERRAYEEERKKPRPTIDELKAKYGPTWGIAQPVDEPAVREATARRLAEINERGLLAEYAAAGLEPQRTSDGTLLSLSLLRSVREHERRDGGEEPAS